MSFMSFYFATSFMHVLDFLFTLILLPPFSSPVYSTEPSDMVRSSPRYIIFLLSLVNLGWIVYTPMDSIYGRFCVSYAYAEFAG